MFVIVADESKALPNGEPTGDILADLELFMKQRLTPEWRPLRPLYAQFKKWQGVPGLQMHQDLLPLLRSLPYIRLRTVPPRSQYEVRSTRRHHRCIAPRRIAAAYERAEGKAQTYEDLLLYMPGFVTKNTVLAVGLLHGHLFMGAELEIMWGALDPKEVRDALEKYDDPRDVKRVLGATGHIHMLARAKQLMRKLPS